MQQSMRRRLGLGNLRLGTRIAMTILAAIVAIQGLNVLTISLLPFSPPAIYSAHALVEGIEQAAELLTLPEAERTPRTAELSDRSKLDIVWSQRAPELSTQDGGPGSPEPPSIQRLRETLIHHFAASGSQIRVDVDGDGPTPWPQIAMFEPRPPTPPAHAELPVGNHDYPIWTFFRIVLSRPNGEALVITPKPPQDFDWLLTPSHLVGASAIVLVTLLSAWTARRWLKPMDRLVEAAKRLGHERVASPIDTTGLADFTVIADALNDMQKRVQGFIDDRTQMLGAVSHDLRTALTRLKLGLEEIPDGDGRDMLRTTIDDMESMITATLTFAGDDLKRERSKNVDIAALVITTCDTFQDLGATVSYQGPDHAFAVCQHVALRRAVMNVVDNAVKYGHQADITLENEEQALVIRVHDQGPGIPPDLIDDAFRPFRRLEHSRNRDTGGTGLGLAIAKDVMSAHGGTIRLQNRPEGGLEAILELPKLQPH